MKATAITCHDGCIDVSECRDYEAVTIVVRGNLGRDMEFTLDERGVAELCEWLQGWQKELDA